MSLKFFFDNISNGAIPMYRDIGHAAENAKIFFYPSVEHETYEPYFDGNSIGGLIRLIFKKPKYKKVLERRFDWSSKPRWTPHYDVPGVFHPKYKQALEIPMMDLSIDGYRKNVIKLFVEFQNLIKAPLKELSNGTVLIVSRSPPPSCLFDDKEGCVIYATIGLAHFADYINLQPLSSNGYGICELFTGNIDDYISKYLKKWV